MTARIPDLYNKHFVIKTDERLGLFRDLTQRCSIHKGLYPGSFVHVTPSFVIPEMAYVDTDKRCRKFFSGSETVEFIRRKKEYPASPQVRFHPADFSKRIPEDPGSFDLLISLYAGFISKYCGQYLREGGILVANNSHGDASLAHLDSGFEFVGVILRRGEGFRFVDDGLDKYFVTKTGDPIDRRKVERTMRGPAFVRTAYAYVFRRQE